MLHSRKKRAVGDMIGAVILIIMMISVVVLLGLAVSSFFTTQQSLHNVSTIHQLENEENFTVVQEAHVPPSGSPGILITNNGLALNITNLIARNSVGSLVFTPVSVVVGHLQSVSIPVSVNTVGFMTSYGGVFFYNFSSPGLVPVSIMAYETTIESPYSAGLWYVPVGTAVNVHSADRGTWYVNGSAVTNGKSSSSVTVDGPTSITVVRDYYVSVSTNPAGAGSVSPVSGWYPVGTQLTFSEIPFASSTVRYIFTSWSGTYSSTSTSFSETVSGPITETANYITQFYVSISSPNGWGNPQGAGWYNAGSTATVSVTSPYSTGAGSQVVFSSWSGTLGSNNNPFSFTVNSPISENVNWIQQYYVSVSASPSGGASSLSPSNGWYDAGAQVTFSETPNTGAGYQYVFQSWSGTYSSASTSFSETVNQPITETANYQLQYYLTMNVNPAGAGSISPSSGWINAGSQVGISATANSGYAFQSWTGSGSGSYSGTSSSATITMNGPITETANFLYNVMFTTEQATDGSAPSPGAGISGVTITLVSSGGTQYSGATNSQGQIGFNVPTGTYSLSVENPVPISSGEEFYYKGSIPSSITVTGPSSYVYNYAEFYWVTAGVAPGGAGSVSVSPSSGYGNWFWYGYGLTFSETPNTGAGYQYAFQSWSGTYSSTATSFSETVTQPITETANYQLQYYLTVSSPNNWGNPQGAGWYNAGSSATFSVTSPVSTGNGQQEVFASWSGSGSGSYSGSNNPVTVVMNSPITETANWQQQFYLTMQVSPADSGTTSPATGWYNSGSSVTITATPNSYDVFYSWVGSGTGSYSGANNPATITMNSPVNETATFGAGIAFQESGLGGDAQGTVLTVSYDGNTYTYSYSQLPVTVKEPLGTTISYSYSSPLTGSTSGEQYVWQSTSGLKNAQSATFTIKKSGTITGNYQKQYYLSMNVNPAGAGSVSPSSEWVNAGSQVGISATTNSGYAFQSWTGSGSGSYSGTSASTTITMNGPITQTANFLYNVVFTTEQATDGSAPSSGAAISGVSITLISSGGTQYSGTTNSQGQIVFNVPAGSYSLSVENPVPISSGEEFYAKGSIPSSLTIDAPFSYTVYYSELYQVITSTNPSGAGTVSLSPSSGYGNWFWYGYGLTFSETPTTGSGFQYAFQSWTGTYSSTASSFSETVTQPITETANYQAQYLVTASSSNYNEYIWAYQGGSVIGPYTGSVWLNAGDQVFVTSQFAIYGQQYMSSGVITSTQLVNGYVDWGGQTYGGYPNWWFNNPQGNFVMMFYGGFTAPSTGTYTIATTSDDGSAVWISTSPSMNPAASSPVVNNWYQQGATQRTGSISLTAGQTYYIIVAYEQGNGGYMVNLQWITPGSSSYTEMPVTGTAYIYGAPFVSSSTSTLYSPGASGNPSTETFYGGVFWSTLNLNAPATVSPSWSPVAYYLTMNANPSGVGSVSPSSGWYNYGASPTISETPASGYTFAGWLGVGPGSYSGSSSTATITMNGMINETANFVSALTITTSGLNPNAQGTVVTVNGQSYSYSQLPTTIYVAPGSTVSYSFSSPISGGSGAQFLWQSTSGPATGQSGSFVINGQTTLTGNYQLQYYLTVSSPNNWGNPQGAGWYNAGSSATFSVTTPVSTGNGQQEVFVSWSGSGSGSYSSSNNPATVVMNNPITETANWQLQYYLTMVANPSIGGSVSPSSGWYNYGASPTISETPASGYTFVDWVGTGSGSYSGTTGSTSITMNAPITETADFQLPQYSYTFNENGLPTGTTWSVTLGNSTEGGTVGGQSGGSPSYSSYYWSESGSSFSLSVTKGQAIIAIYGDYNNNVQLASISDSQGNTWVSISNQNSLGIYAAIASASGTDTISYTAASGATWWGLYVIVVNNIVITNPTVISGSGTSVSSFTPPTGSFVLSAGWVETSKDYPSASPGSGFTQAPSIIAWFLEDGPTYGLYAEYANAWNGGSTTASWSTRSISSAYTTAVVFSPTPSSPSVTSVTFNGLTQPEAWSASASNGWSFFTPSGEVTGQGTQTLYGAIPITINNAQNSATPAPFQQLIQFNPSSYLITNLGAIRFYTSSGTPLYGWLESGTASSASAWVKLPNGIGASSSIQLMMTANSSGFDGNYWGEAPQMSDPFSVTAWTYGGTPPTPSGNAEPSGVNNIGTGYFPSAYAYSTDTWGSYAGNTYLGMPTQPFPPPFAFINSYPPSGTSYGYTATGSFTAPTTGSYTFEMETDDGMEILISGPGLSGWVVAVSSWQGQGATEYTGSVSLQAGGTYQIAIDYFNSGGPGMSAFLVTPSVNWVGSYGQYDNGQNVFNYYWNFASYPSNWGGAPSTLITYDGYTIWGSSTPAGSQTNFNVGSTGVTVDWYGYLSEPSGAGYWDSVGLWGGQYPEWFTWQGQGNYGYGVQNPSISVYYTSVGDTSSEVFSVGYTSSTIYYYLNYVQQPITISYTGGAGWIGFRNGAGSGGGGGSDVFVQWVDVRATPPNGVMPTVTIL